MLLYTICSESPVSHLGMVPFAFGGVWIAAFGLVLDLSNGGWR